jgi:hypothetical protein
MHPLALEPGKPLPDPLLRLLNIQLRHRSIQLLREAMTTPYQFENMLAISEAPNVKECPAQWEHMVCTLEGAEPTQISTIVCSGRRMDIAVQGALVAHFLTPLRCSQGASGADVPTIEAAEAAGPTEASPNHARAVGSGGLHAPPPAYSLPMWMSELVRIIVRPLLHSPACTSQSSHHGGRRA